MDTKGITKGITKPSLVFCKRLATGGSAGGIELSFRQEHSWYSASNVAQRSLQFPRKGEVYLRQDGFTTQVYLRQGTDLPPSGRIYHTSLPDLPGLPHGFTMDLPDLPPSRLPDLPQVFATDLPDLPPSRLPGLPQLFVTDLPDLPPSRLPDLPDLPDLPTDLPPGWIYRLYLRHSVASQFDLKARGPGSGLHGVYTVCTGSEAVRCRIYRAAPHFLQARCLAV